MRVKRKVSLVSEVRSGLVSVRDKLTTTFPTCLRCGTSNMSSIPMGAHAAFKVRRSLSNNRDQNEKFQPNMSFSNAEAGQPQVQLSPARYNSKLMNSVWGMYNRYSVHNIKSQIAFEKN